MSMTNQQGAPEALRHADGLESFARMLPAYGFDPQPLKDAAATVRSLHAIALELADQLSGKNERLAALVEAQQPAPSAAAAVNPYPHAELRKTWRPGQRWQARSFRNGQWGPWTDAVASEPFWFPHQDYRRHPDDLAPQRVREG